MLGGEPGHEPGMVWLMFIPLFNVVWHFIIVLNMAKSLGANSGNAARLKILNRAKHLA